MRKHVEEFADLKSELSSEEALQLLLNVTFYHVIIRTFPGLCHFGCFSLKPSPFQKQTFYDELIQPERKCSF